MASEKRFAVLIDADNISAKYIKIVLDELTKDGVATYKRIYGDWTNPALISWKDVLLDNSVLPIQQYSYTTGKNATDSALIINAMDILYSGQVDGFCIVSSDSDFTRLAARLRESGMLVLGMGERKTPKPFIAACNRFKYLDILAAPARPVPREKPASQDKNILGEKMTLEKGSLQERMTQMERITGQEKNLVVAQIRQTQKDIKPDLEIKPMYRSSSLPSVPILEQETSTKEDMTDLKTVKAAIRAIAEEYCDDDDWIFTGTIGSMLVKRYPDFDARNFGYRKLTSFLESLDLFAIKSVRTGDGDARLIYVKLKG